MCLILDPFGGIRHITVTFLVNLCAGTGALSTSVGLPPGNWLAAGLSDPLPGLEVIKLIILSSTEQDIYQAHKC